MATPSQFIQCYAHAPESAPGAWDWNCPICIARFCTGAKQAVRHGVSFALYCHHDERLLIARPMLDDQFELSLAGPMPESAAIDAVAAANADGQRLLYQHDITH
ncbi:hypothetical protein [Cupriavidus numazuensis]|uniref:Uncharacterized protein n=1 Tax=Cupriavidus numazuensis TaxID=221992 RepID=A0ABM8TKD6_9BURK|nr:hypothetical protein [Cupriavidus numazuensis]CAG2151854.1 hypothetical protein LMG26411_04031 [Cupriavidus numazuensis]